VFVIIVVDGSEKRVTPFSFYIVSFLSMRLVVSTVKDKTITTTGEPAIQSENRKT
jgi:hypothetical protein